MAGSHAPRMISPRFHFAAPHWLHTMARPQADGIYHIVCQFQWGQGKLDQKGRPLALYIVNSFLFLLAKAMPQEESNYSAPWIYMAMHTQALGTGVKMPPWIQMERSPQVCVPAIGSKHLHAVRPQPCGSRYTS